MKNNFIDKILPKMVRKTEINTYLKKEKKLTEFVKQVQDIGKLIVFRHCFPDHDAIGAAYGAASIFMEMGIEVYVMNGYVYNEVDKEESKRHDFKDNPDLFTPYNLEGFKFEEFNEITELPTGLKEYASLIVDCTNLDRVEGMTKEILSNSIVIGQMDHHPERGDVEILDNVITLSNHNSPSACHMLNVYSNMLGRELSERTKFCLSNGMQADTVGFSLKDSDDSFYKEDALAYLIMTNRVPSTYLSWNRQKWLDSISKISPEVEELKRDIVEKHGNLINDISVVYMPSSVYSSTDYAYTWFGKLSNSLGSMLFIDKEQDKFWKTRGTVCGVELPDGTVKISFRTPNGNYWTAKDIAEKHDGGGHVNAASCVVSNKEVFDEIVKEITSLEYKKPLQASGTPEFVLKKNFFYSLTDDYVELAHNGEELVVISVTVKGKWINTTKLTYPAALVDKMTNEQLIEDNGIFIRPGETWSISRTKAS